MNKDKHDHSCDKGTTIIYWLGGGVHWILQDPIIFLSTNTKSKHLLSWTLAFIPSKKLQVKAKKKKKKKERKLKKIPVWKFLLNYSLSGSPSFINYLFSIFWQWINFFHWDGDQIVYFRKKMRFKIFI